MKLARIFASALALGVSTPSLAETTYPTIGTGAQVWRDFVTDGVPASGAADVVTF